MEWFRNHVPSCPYSIAKASVNLQNGPLANNMKGLKDLSGYGEVSSSSR